MSVVISGVEVGSPAAKFDIEEGDLLLSLNGNEIADVLDYRFYQNDEKVTARILKADGKEISCKIKKGEYDEIGFVFNW